MVFDEFPNAIVREQTTVHLKQIDIHQWVALDDAPSVLDRQHIPTDKLEVRKDAHEFSDIIEEPAASSGSWYPQFWRPYRDGISQTANALSFWKGA